jgi:hypothetical protein
MLLITGGIHDPNIACIVSTASRLGARFEVAYAGICRFDWDMDGELKLNKRIISPKSIFQRFNTFGYDINNKDTYQWYHNWYHAFRSYALNRELRCFDLGYGMNAFCKPLDMFRAKRLGLRLPKTLITENTVPNDCIFKPIMGGDHTILLEDKTPYARGIGFAQQHLKGQEYRVYVVGDQTFAFRMETKSLDYRLKQDVNCVPIMPSEMCADGYDVCHRVKALSHEMKLNYSASDLKMDDAGNLHFLEINSAPMFSEFDRAMDGMLSETMVKWLVKES